MKQPARPRSGEPGKKKSKPRTGSARTVSPSDVLAFWFEELDPKDWFVKKAATDARIRERFAATHLRLAKAVPQAWRKTADAHLALIIVLDQFPRNIYRDTPLAFATDGLALKEAKLAVDGGHDMAVDPKRRVFFYMPFEHSENLADQKRSVELISALNDKSYTEYAHKHRDVIAEYGRFPHRNAILGRTSTAAEERYLSQPGAGF